MATGYQNSTQAALAIGLMSGTSLDGVDASLLRTDGLSVVEPIADITKPYDDALRGQLREILKRAEWLPDVSQVERALTLAHVEAVESLLQHAGVAREAVTVVGFHGQTILHRPDRQLTWQIGDGGLLADVTGINVVSDFRSADVAAGGQGAPFAPIYHAALATKLDLPVAVLNIGGVANVTWIGDGNTDLIAFDTGPGNALMDDWVLAKSGQNFDAGGQLAMAGAVNTNILSQLLANPYFEKAPPKSLDRNDFDPLPIAALSAADGAATLAAFTIECIALAADHFPAPVRRWLITGGGRHNKHLMDGLADRLKNDVSPVEAVGWNGDALEAQAFAYLAVRSLMKLPISFPTTTGVPAPTVGGRINLP